MESPTQKQKIGRIGEDIAQKYLKNKGFEVICQNYLKKCGEIDIVAEKGKILHFIEVKTISELANSRLGRSESINISSTLPRRGLGSPQPRREFANSETDNYRPEDNVHPNKLKRLARTIQLYLFEKHPNGAPEWVFDVITVRLDMKNRKAGVQILNNIII